MRRHSGKTLAAGMAIAWAGSALAGPTPAATVTLSPGPMDEAANKGEVKVRIVVPGVDVPAGAALFPTPPTDNLIVTDARGVVPGATGEGHRWAPSRAVKGNLTIAYTVLLANSPSNGGTTPIFPRIDGAGFSAIGMTLLAVPTIQAPYRIRIRWDLKAMGPGATAVSSAGDGNVELPAGPLSRLRDTAFMAGKLTRYPVKPSGNFSAAWSGNPGYDLTPPMEWAGKLHSYMTGFFQTHNDPAYRVFLRDNGGRNPGGGVAFPNSFFETYGPGITGKNMNRILGHEMTHTFTSNGLGNWYVEGDAVYYQVQLPWRAGMTSTEDYLRDINLTAARYYTNAEIDAPESRIIPNFFTNPWMNTLGYDRGALYFAALNGIIRRASDGKRSVDDLVRVLVNKKRGGGEIAVADWVELIRKDAGDAGVALHDSMLAGGIVVPESGDYGPCFRRFTTKIRRYELGFKAADAAGGKVVADLVSGSEADKAGLRNGDAVVMPVITTEGVKRDLTATVTIQVTRAGKTFPITYLPRGVAVDAYQWERVADVPDSACRP